MKRRTFLKTSLGAGFLSALNASQLANSKDGLPLSPRLQAWQWRERALLGFGTTLSLRVAHRDSSWAEAALDAAVATIRRIEAQMSLFRPDSPLMQLNRAGVLNDPPSDLLAIFQLAQTISTRSSGAFDITVQPLWQVFDSAHRAGRLPSPDAVRAARTRVGWQALEISAEYIRFLKPGMGVTLNGIAQGYAADRVREQLQEFGVEHALINTGEWSSLGRAQSQRPWALGIADPRNKQALVARLAMDRQSIATSADNETSFSNDLRHHHIFDPETGYSPLEIASATVIGPSCALADALAKVMFVKGVEGALAVAGEWKVDALIVDKMGSLHLTEGLKTL